MFSAKIVTFGANDQMYVWLHNNDCVEYVATVKK